MIYTAHRMNNAETYYFATKLAQIREMNAQGMHVINLGIGSPDLPPHASVTEALTKALSEKDAHQYQPYKGIAQLNNAFAQWYKMHFDVDIDGAANVLPLIGSKEGIMHISMTFLNEGDEVLVPNPGYPSYSMATKLAGGTVRYFDLIEELNFQPDLDKLAQEDLSKVKLMWINYPNMPTGGNADLDFYTKLLAFAKAHDILICHDNPYTFILNDAPCNIFQVEGAMEHAIELTSLSKNYNMAGWRIGAVTGSKDYINHIMRFKSNMDSGMFKPMQLAGAQALSLGAAWFQELNDEYQKRKVVALQILQSLGCAVRTDNAGMFVYGRIPAAYDGAETLSEIILHEAKVFITPGHIFGSNGAAYLRISLCSPVAQIQEALDRITSCPNINTI
jgi:LL-diaminopimelate aminotransferase